MVDQGEFSRHGRRTPPLSADDDWMARWNERHAAVRGALGETVPPGAVHSFSWKDRVLPGACCLTFPETAACRLYMTLGLTQTLDRSDPAYPWEFAVRAEGNVDWPVDLLYQLVTQWLSEREQMGFGYYLPLRFFTGGDGKLWASTSQSALQGEILGAVRGLYLWTDARHRRFEVSSGAFGLLTVIGVSADEDRLAQATTPAHLMLLLRRLGVAEICDPHRPCVLTLPTTIDHWATIEGLSHDDVLAELEFGAG